jgi:hypothetical protein
MPFIQKRINGDEKNEEIYGKHPGKDKIVFIIH